MKARMALDVRCQISFACLLGKLVFSLLNHMGHFDAIALREKLISDLR